MKKTCLSLIILMFPASLLASETMTKIVIRDISHFIKKGSTLSKPKTLYRSGLQYARFELAPDPEKNTQLLLMVHEPDVWNIDRVAKTGQHSIDSENEAHFPIWSGSTIPEPLDGLEYGMEFEFLKKFKTPKSGSVTLEGIPCDRYNLKRGKYQIEVFAKSGTEIPVEVRVFEDSKPQMDDFYDSYETGLPLDPSLFQVPKNVKISEPAQAGSDWKEFKPEGGRSSILMPDSPKKDEGEVEMWIAQDSESRSFSLSYSDMNNQIVDTDGFFGDLVKAGAKATNSKVLKQNTFTYKGFPACDFRLTNGENLVSLSRICLANQRLYVLTVTSTREDFNAKLVQKFFDSFQVISPKLDQGK